MNHLILLFSILLLSINSFSQYIHDKNNIFISTNIGVFKTPVGIKVGYVYKKMGTYVGFRYGRGEIFDVFPNDYDRTVKTDLYSITSGFIKQIFQKEKISFNVSLGLGYGKWWKTRRSGWTDKGFEIELGTSLFYKRFLFNIGYSFLNGHLTYPTDDILIGIGYRF